MATLVASADLGSGAPSRCAVCFILAILSVPSKNSGVGRLIYTHRHPHPTHTDTHSDTHIYTHRVQVTIIHPIIKR